MPSAASTSAYTAARPAGLGQTLGKGGDRLPEPGAQDGLFPAAAIERGLKERRPEAARELLKTREPLEIINGAMIPALDRVGKGFEKGTIFLPQLLMSAEAATGGL